MKILVANVSTSAANDPFVVEKLVPLWKKNMQLVMAPDTELTFRFPEWGIHGMEGNFSHAIKALEGPMIYQMCKNAEKEGFDAVLITCFADSFMEHLRQLIDIPVIGIGEASFSIAQKMGKRFGVVTISKYNEFQTMEQIRGYGFGDLCIGVVATEETAAEQPRALFNAEESIQAFYRAADQLINKGAEVIIPGCGLLTPGLRLAPGCEKEYPNGVTQYKGAAVMDVLSVGILEAELMAKLKKAGCAWIGRNGWYAMPTQEMKESGQLCLADNGITFWDVH